MKILSTICSLILLSVFSFAQVIQVTGPAIGQPPITITLEISAPVPCTINGIPQLATLLTNQTQQFTTTTNNCVPATVTWDVNGIVGGNAIIGTVSVTGLYTAPVAVPSPATVTLTVTANGDVTKKASAFITIVAPSVSAENKYCLVGDIPNFGTVRGTALTPTACNNTAVANTPTPGIVRGGINSLTTLNTALAAAQCGDIIEIIAGTVINTITGTGVTIPTKTCNPGHYIQIRSSDYASFPVEGNRVSPCYFGVASLPGRPNFNCGSTVNHGVKIVSSATVTSSNMAITFAGNNKYWRIGPGIEITRPTGGGRETALVNVVAGGIDHLIFDRIWGHGNETDETTRFIDLSHSSNMSFVNGFYSQFFCLSPGSCSDAQVFGGGLNTNSLENDGTYKWYNNFLEAAAQSILMGGGGSTVVPKNLEARRNYMFKPQTWNPNSPTYDGGVLLGTAKRDRVVKNIFELKTGDKTFVEGNVLENVWAGFSQSAYVVVITPKNAGACPGCSTTNFTYRYNKTKTSCGFLQLANIISSAGFAPLSGNNYSIYDNVSDNIHYTTAYKCGAGIVPIVAMEDIHVGASFVLHDVLISHNTIVKANPNFGTSPGAIGTSGAKLTTGLQIFNMNVLDNLFANGTAGTSNVIGGGQIQCAENATGTGSLTGGKTMLDACWQPYTLTNNAIINVGSTIWPGTNCTSETSFSSIFVNYNNGLNGDYHVNPASLCHNTSTDARDPGADIDRVNTETTGVDVF